MYSAFWECGIIVLLRKPQYEVCPIKTCTRIHPGEGVATIRKNYHRLFDKYHHSTSWFFPSAKN
jgi:hypothetical protein